MSTSVAMSNVTSGFIDLATFDEIDKYMYGGNKASTYFVRETRKSTWFTQIPVCLTKKTGTEGPTFTGPTQAQYEINRHGDYFLNTWVEIQLPRVVVNDPGTNDPAVSPVACDKYIMWTPNLGHNIIANADITFNDQQVNPNGGISSQFLDFWASFTVPTDKAGAYNTMIGNTSDLCTPHTVLPAKTLYIPIPFFYTLDTGVALPMAALPYNVIQVRINYEELSKLLLTVTCPENNEGNQIVNARPTDYHVDGVPRANVWGTYALVSNDERQRMGCAPRDILIEQVQTTGGQGTSLTVTSDPTSLTTELNFSHSVKALMFGMFKTGGSAGLASNLRSNYTTGNYYMGTNGGVYLANNNNDDSTLNGVHYGAGSPIENVSLLYENTNRLCNMTADYFELVNPYYTAVSAPGIVAPHTATPYYTNGNTNINVAPKYASSQTTEGNKGINLYSYSLDFAALDPMGSTNYGKLTHVSLVTKFSRSAREQAHVTDGGNQCYQLSVIAVNNTILRVSGGAMGFAVI